MFQFRRGYLIASLAFLTIEVLIALFLKDAFIRPYGGDFLVVIFLYCLLRAFLNLSVKNSLILVLAFAYSIEFLQHLDFVAILGLKEDDIAAVVLGNYFGWEDIIVYTFGALTTLITEKILLGRRNELPVSSEERFHSY